MSSIDIYHSDRYIEVPCETIKEMKKRLKNQNKIFSSFCQGPNNRNQMKVSLKDNQFETVTTMRIEAENFLKNNKVLK